MNGTCTKSVAGLMARGGYSLVEVMICTVIVAGMFTAAIHTLGAVRLSERQTVERARAHLLAEALMEELWRHAYDELDAFDGWSSAPPTRLDATPLTGFDGWTTEIAVGRVRADTPEQTRTGEYGLRRLTVTVQRNELVLAELSALRGRGLHKERPTGAIAP